MTEQEKQQLVDAVITQLKNEGTDVSSASVVEDVNGVSYILCYDTNGNIVRVSPDTINQQESTNKDAIKANATAIANEAQRAQNAEQALGMALQDGLNQEATARGNLAKDIRANAMQYDTLGVYVRADKAEIYGRSIDTTPRVVEFPAATTEKAGVMSAEDKKKVNASIKDIVVNPNVDDVELDLEDNTEKISHVVFPAATPEKAGVMSAEDKVTLNSIPNEIDKIKYGDTIVGQAREIHSRNGKNVTDSFLARTTAGSGTIGDGVASLKSVGGNIVKNLVDGTFESGWMHYTTNTSSINKDISTITSQGVGGVKYTVSPVAGHIYYISAMCKVINGELTFLFGNVLVRTTNNDWHSISYRNAAQSASGVFMRNDNPNSSVLAFVRKPLLIDLTEMFGAGNEPTKEECDKLFGTMDALPQGLNIANPTAFTSTGFNRFNPDNVLENKAIVDNAIVSGDKKIAVIECLPCKVGTGENNGYCINGDFGEDIKVYLTPLNPMEVEGELYMHELTKDTTTDTYVPQIKGYMLVEVPTTANLCAHFLWSEDKCERDTYEPYFESKVELPVIPQMSEWGLAGIQSSGTLIADEIDFERGVYIKKIGSVDMGTLNWICKTEESMPYHTAFISNRAMGSYNIRTGKYTTNSKSGTANLVDKTIVGGASFQGVYLRDLSYNDASSLKAALQGVMLYYELATPEEYPLPKVDNNYISSDYGVEQFNSVVPCNANNLYYMRSLAGETRNFLDRMYDNTAKTNANEVADYITSGIEGNKKLATNAPNLALRALYVAAGAEYNDTGDDKTKTAPWGETVTHKAGHYYLNGLGDITEEQMMDIYKSVHWSISHNISNMFWGVTFRTNFAPMNKGFRELDATDGVIAKGAFMHSISLEVAVVSALDTPYNNAVYGIQVCHAASMFLRCKKLKHIIGILPSGMVADTSTLSTMFKSCPMLENIKLYSVKHNVSFSDSALISKESILYCITNAAPSSAITITLHPDAYARLADDSDIVAALEAQPLVTLVSA